MGNILKKFLVLLVLTLTGFSFVNASLGDSVVNYFAMEDLTDSLGYATVTTGETLVQVEGKNGQAIIVSGSGGGDPSSQILNAYPINQNYFSTTSDYCFSYWAKYSNLLTGGFLKWSLTDNNSNLAILNYAGINSESFEFLYIHDGITSEYEITYDNNFHHYLVCARGDTDSYYVYEDNVQKFYGERGTVEILQTPLTLVLGGSRDFNWGSTGVMVYDEFAIFNKLLNETERQMIYNNGGGCFYGDECFSSNAFYDFSLDPFWIIEPIVSLNDNVLYYNMQLGLLNMDSLLNVTVNLYNIQNTTLVENRNIVDFDLTPESACGLEGCGIISDQFDLNAYGGGSYMIEVIIQNQDSPQNKIYFNSTEFLIENPPINVVGCLDPNALNYNINVTISDPNSCVYISTEKIDKIFTSMGEGLGGFLNGIKAPVTTLIIMLSMIFIMVVFGEAIVQSIKRGLKK